MVRRLDDPRYYRPRGRPAPQRWKRSAVRDHYQGRCSRFASHGKTQQRPWQHLYDGRQRTASAHFPDIQTNTIGFPVSLGTFNAQQQSDVHAYWEFNHGTDWSFPTYELPFTGGIPPSFQDGQVGALSSVVPGSGPSGIKNNPVTFGDAPDNPRDPDRADADVQAQREKRLRVIPSGLDNEIHLDVFLRIKSFEPGIPLPQRLFDAYAKEVARVDKDGDGVVSFEEADIDGTSDGLPNTRLYLPATAFDRYAMTREINDGLLA